MVSGFSIFVKFSLSSSNLDVRYALCAFFLSKRAYISTKEQKLLLLREIVIEIDQKTIFKATTCRVYLR